MTISEAVVEYLNTGKEEGMTLDDMIEEIWQTSHNAIIEWTETGGEYDGK